jgi:hypothetical protein
MTWSNLLLFTLLATMACAQAPSSKEVESVYPEAHDFYLDLHPGACAAPAIR